MGYVILHGDCHFSMTLNLFLKTLLPQECGIQRLANTKSYTFRNVTENKIVFTNSLRLPMKMFRKNDTYRWHARKTNKNICHYRPINQLRVGRYYLLKSRLKLIDVNALHSVRYFSHGKIIHYSVVFTLKRYTPINRF